MSEARNAAGGPLLNTDEAAALIGIRPSTLHEWRTQGRGPRYARIGRLVMYRRADLDAWVDAQVREPGAEARAS